MSESSAVDKHDLLRMMFVTSQEQIAFGDSKAGLLLTSDAILMAALTTLASGEGGISSRVGGGVSSAYGLFIAALLLLSIAIVLGLLTILPNIKNLLWPNPSAANFPTLERCPVRTTMIRLLAHYQKRFSEPTQQ